MPDSNQSQEPLFPPINYGQGNRVAVVRAPGHQRAISLLAAIMARAISVQNQDEGYDSMSEDSEMDSDG